MCLRFVFLLITRLAAWMRLSRREEAWKPPKSYVILRHQDLARPFTPRAQLLGDRVSRRGSGPGQSRSRSPSDGRQAVSLSPLSWQSHRQGSSSRRASPRFSALAPLAWRMILDHRDDRVMVAVAA